MVSATVAAPWYFTGVWHLTNWTWPYVLLVTHTHSLAFEPLERL